MALHAVAMGDTPSFDGEAIAEFNVTSSVTVSQRDIPAFDETHVGDQADTAFLIREVGPDDIIENVGFDGVDGGGEGGDFLRAGGVLEGGGVDGEAGEVVEVRVRDEIGGDEVAEKVGGVGVGGLVREDETCKGAGIEREPGSGRFFHGARGPGLCSFGFRDWGEVIGESFGWGVVV